MHKPNKLKMKKVTNIKIFDRSNIQNIHADKTMTMKYTLKVLYKILNH